MKKPWSYFANKETRLPAVLIAFIVVMVLAMGGFAAVYFLSRPAQPEVKIVRGKPTFVSQDPAPDYNGYFGIEHDGTMDTEVILSAKQLKGCDRAGAVNYVFLTDLHADTEVTGHEREVGYALCLATLRQAVTLTNTCDDVDFLAIGGDFADGYRDKADYVKTVNGLKEILADCQKPVVLVRGNHDTNTGGNQAADQHIAYDEWHALMQEPFKEDFYVYDDACPDGNYFYFDLPAKKTRVVVLDSINDTFAGYQTSFLENKVFTVSEQGWQYVILEHYPLNETYSVSGKESGGVSAEVLNALIPALNNRTTYDKQDYTGFRSVVSCVTHGHTHASFAAFDKNLGCFIANTPTCGLGVPESLYYFNTKKLWRGGSNTTGSDQFVFDLYSVTPETLLKIRVGNGMNAYLTHNDIAVPGTPKS